MGAAEFQFVVSNGPKLPVDSNVRALIHKKAMRNVAEVRRIRGDFDKTGRPRQPPKSKQSESDSSGSSPDQSANMRSANATTTKSSTPRRNKIAFKSGKITSHSVPLIPPPLSEYEAARVRFGLSLEYLGMLTNFNVGAGVTLAVSSDPGQLITLLGHRQWSYMNFAPSLYGTSNCVTAATDCLLERVARLLRPHQERQEDEFDLYAKSLRSLQHALQDEDQCLGTDVLCASQLLSLRELLDTSREMAWSVHIQGSAKLVKRRAAHRFKTEFDRALFLAHLGPLVFDALMSNKHTYLEERDWMELYESLAKESEYLTDRSPLAIKVHAQMFCVPGLWHDVQEYIYSEYTDPEPLEVRCREIHASLLDCLEDYQAHCIRLSLINVPCEELAKRRELYGLTLECLAVIKRLLATIAEEDRVMLEVETQKTAHLILELQNKPSPEHSWLFSGHEMGVAQCIVATKEDWESVENYISNQEEWTARQARYKRWNDMMRSREAAHNHEV